MPSVGFGPDIMRTRLQRELQGWRVWFTLSFTQTQHSWSAMPAGAQVAVIVVPDADLLLGKCREYEENIEEHILDAQEVLERERDTAPTPRLNLLTAHLDSLMSLRVLLTARKAGIEVPS